MNTISRWLSQCLPFFRANDDAQRLARQYELRQLEKNLASDLKAKTVVLEHDIALIKAKNAAELTAMQNQEQAKNEVLAAHHAAELAMLRTQKEAELTMLKAKCQQDIKDYQQYLSSLDQLKKSIQSSYPQLPEAMAFTIHHHAKFLLNKMWEAQALEDKMHYEAQFLRFMTTLHEEAHDYLAGLSQKTLPEKTLNLLQNK